MKIKITVIRRYLLPKYFFTIQFYFISLSILLFSGIHSNAQDLYTKPPIPYSQQFDIKDMLKDIFSKKKKTLDTAVLKPSPKFNLSVLPGVSYNPATSVIAGVSTSMSWYFGNPSNTTNSSISTGVSYSVLNQLKVSIQSNIFTNRNKWLIGGDWRFWIYVQDTYGLGTNSPQTGAQNMDFSFIRFNQNLLLKVYKHLYAGIGYDLEYYTNISTINNDNDSTIYPNYNNTYNQFHGFDTTSYVSSGFMLTANYDSRDNTINPFKGLVLSAQYRNYNKFLGSSKNSQQINYQIRNYQSLTKNDTYILAFWFLGSTILNGEIPYMTLNATGWDKYNAAGRGYTQGRFRGRDYMYFEIENRITITKNRFFGIAVFANAETLSDPDSGVKLFEYVKPAAGIGLRFLFDKYSRTNLCIDYGHGVDGSSGVWLNLGEFF